MAVIATGFFDGVHIGHRQIIKTLLQVASGRSQKSLVLTFWPHPKAVLCPDAPQPVLLTGREEKLRILRSLGADEVVELDFTPSFAAMTTRQYLEMLRRDFDATAVILGYDNTIGSDRLPPESTAQIARSLGMDAVIVDPVTLPGLSRPVSSSEIRRALEAGDNFLAEKMLGNPN